MGRNKKAELQCTDTPEITIRKPEEFKMGCAYTDEDIAVQVKKGTVIYYAEIENALYMKFELGSDSEEVEEFVEAEVFE